MSSVFFQALAENKSSTEEESTEEEEVHVVNEDVKRENTKTLSKMEKRGVSKVKVNLVSILQRKLIF